MVHEFFGGTVPEVQALNAEFPDQTALKIRAEFTISEFPLAFDDLNFSEALKLLCLSCANRRLPDRESSIEVAGRPHRARSPGAAGARAGDRSGRIRLVTALVYPILPDAAAKV